MMVEPPKPKATGYVECLGGPLDGRRVPNRGPKIETVKEKGHVYNLTLIGTLDDPKNRRRLVYAYEYPGTDRW